MAKYFGVIIAAAGRGKRFGGRKQLLELKGRPLLSYSLDVFSSFEEVSTVVVVAPPDDRARIDEIVSRWRETPPPREGRVARSPTIQVVEGGDRRQDSVRRGLEALRRSGRRVDDRASPAPWTIEWVLVHDAARPLVGREEVSDVMDAVRHYGAAAIGHPVTDSVRAERDGHVVEELERDHVWQVQTPQGARLDYLWKAYETLGGEETKTDEVALLGVIGVRARLVRGSRENIKVTHPGDEELAAFLMERRSREEG